MIVLTLMLFFILSYMYYLFYIDVDTRHIKEVGFIGDGITFGEHSLDRNILIFEKNVDIAVYLALEELAENGGVPLGCKNIWNKPGCEPTDDVVLNEFNILLIKSLNQNLLISKVLSEGRLKIERQNKPIIMTGDFSFNAKPFEKNKNYFISVKRKYRFDKIYDYDLGIYHDTYTEFKDDSTVTDNHRFTHFKLVDPDIHYKFERLEFITSAENKPTS